MYSHNSIFDWVINFKLIINRNEATVRDGSLKEGWWTAYKKAGDPRTIINVWLGLVLVLIVLIRYTDFYLDLFGYAQFIGIRIP